MELDKVTREILRTRGWSTIDELAEEVKRRNLLDDTWFEGVYDRALKADLRRILRQKGEDGWPEFANIKRTSDEGAEEPIYKQELLFDIDDYRQVIKYHADRAEYHYNTALGYQRNAYQRYAVQIPLPVEIVDSRIPVS